MVSFVQIERASRHLESFAFDGVQDDNRSHIPSTQLFNFGFQLIHVRLHRRKSSVIEREQSPSYRSRLIVVGTSRRLALFFEKVNSKFQIEVLTLEILNFLETQRTISMRQFVAANLLCHVVVYLSSVILPNRTHYRHEWIYAEISFLSFSRSSECMIHDIPRPINKKKPPIRSVKIPLLFVAKEENEVI